MSRWLKLKLKLRQAQAQAIAPALVSAVVPLRLAAVRFGRKGQSKRAGGGAHRQYQYWVMGWRGRERGSRGYRSYFFFLVGRG